MNIKENIIKKRDLMKEYLQVPTELNNKLAKYATKIENELIYETYYAGTTYVVLPTADIEKELNNLEELNQEKIANALETLESLDMHIFSEVLGEYINYLSSKENVVGYVGTEEGIREEIVKKFDEDVSEYYEQIEGYLLQGKVGQDTLNNFDILVCLETYSGILEEDVYAVNKELVLEEVKNYTRNDWAKVIKDEIEHYTKLNEKVSGESLISGLVAEGYDKEKLIDGMVLLKESGYSYIEPTTTEIVSINLKNATTKPEVTEVTEIISDDEPNLVELTVPEYIKEKIKELSEDILSMEANIGNLSKEEICLMEVLILNKLNYVKLLKEDNKNE